MSTPIQIQTQTQIAAFLDTITSATTRITYSSMLEKVKDVLHDTAFTIHRVENLTTHTHTPISVNTKKVMYTAISSFLKFTGIPYDEIKTVLKTLRLQPVPVPETNVSKEIHSLRNTVNALANGANIKPTDLENYCMFTFFVNYPPPHIDVFDVTTHESPDHCWYSESDGTLYFGDRAVLVLAPRDNELLGRYIHRTPKRESGKYQGKLFPYSSQLLRQRSLRVFGDVLSANAFRKAWHAESAQPSIPAPTSQTLQQQILELQNTVNKLANTLLETQSVKPIAPVQQSITQTEQPTQPIVEPQPFGSTRSINLFLSTTHHSERNQCRTQLNRIKRHFPDAMDDKRRILKFIKYSVTNANGNDYGLWSRQNTLKTYYSYLDYTGIPHADPQPDLAEIQESVDYKNSLAPPQHSNTLDTLLQKVHKLFESTDPTDLENYCTFAPFIEYPPLRLDIFNLTTNTKDPNHYDRETKQFVFGELEKTGDSITVDLTPEYCGKLNAYIASHGHTTSVFPLSRLTFLDRTTNVFGEQLSFCEFRSAYISAKADEIRHAGLVGLAENNRMYELAKSCNTTVHTIAAYYYRDMHTRYTALNELAKSCNTDVRTMYAYYIRRPNSQDTNQSSQSENTQALSCSITDFLSSKDLAVPTKKSYERQLGRIQQACPDMLDQQKVLHFIKHEITRENDKEYKPQSKHTALKAYCSYLSHLKIEHLKLLTELNEMRTENETVNARAPNQYANTLVTLTQKVHALALSADPLDLENYCMYAMFTEYPPLRRDIFNLTTNIADPNHYNAQTRQFVFRELNKTGDSITVDLTPEYTNKLNEYISIHGSTQVFPRAPLTFVDRTTKVFGEQLSFRAFRRIYLKGKEDETNAAGLTKLEKYNAMLAITKKCNTSIHTMYAYYYHED